MTARFQIDLTHPGSTYRVRGQWFVGPRGPRHLAAAVTGAVVILLVFGLGGVLPRHLQYANDLISVAKLRQDVAAAGTELETLRANLRDISIEANRQVRWSELLPALSHRLPEPLKIERVTLSRAGGPTQQGQLAAAGALTLQIDATTPAMAGGGRLIDIANFMAALAQDSTVARQFQLKTWEVKPLGQQSGEEILQITVGFAEKRS